MGTTSSVVSYIKDGHPEVIKIDGNVAVPSVVNYSGEKPIVGWEAIYKADDKSTIFSVKRSMGKDVKFFGRRPEEISADILSYIKLSAELKIGKTIDAAVITVPAHFTDAQRTATKQAASIAGIKVLRLINEPTSAAIAFGLDKAKEGIFAAYDFGGGTFDFSVLRLSDGIFQVIATGGDNHLGGDDVDKKILEYNLSKNGISDISPNDRMRARLAAKFLKESLKNLNAVEKEFSMNREIYHFDLDKDHLKEFAKGLLDRSFAIVSQVLKDAKISTKDLDGVVLVGGMTRLNLVKEAVSEYFKVKIYDDVNPDEVVSLGAAIQAQSIEEKNLMLIDVVPLTLGIETLGGGVDRIIYRNTPIPIKEKREYTTYQDNQTGIKFRVVQGERPLADDCRTLADFELRGIPSMPAGMARVIVEFSVDVNGLLTVKAHEKTTGKSQEILIESASGLSPEELRKILEETFKERESDQRKEKNIAIKIESERSIKFWEAIVGEIPEEF